jgi:hypothetical protein
MQLGAMKPIEEKSIGAADLDFSPFEDRLKAIEQKQTIIIIALIVIAYLIITKK